MMNLWQLPGFNIDIYKYLNEMKLLKPVTCFYQLPTDSGWSHHNCYFSILAKCTYFIQTVPPAMCTLKMTKNIFVKNKMQSDIFGSLHSKIWHFGVSSFMYTLYQWFLPSAYLVCTLRDGRKVTNIIGSP